MLSNNSFLMEKLYLFSEKIPKYPSVIFSLDFTKCQHLAPLGDVVLPMRQQIMIDLCHSIGPDIYSNFIQHLYVKN